MNNAYSNFSMLILEGFVVQTEVGFVLFFSVLAAYVFIVIGNVTLFLMVTFNRRLHAPMYVMLCNMTVCDLMGSSAVLPRMISDFLNDIKLISYEACFIQAFCIHFYSAAAHLILTAMAFDRYVAICDPLRYSTIMTNKTLVKLCSMAWGVSFTLIFILFALVLKLPRCRSQIRHVYCSNGNLFLLSCADTTVNTVFAVFVSNFLTAVSLCAIFWTYAKILITCLFKTFSNSKSKAIHTCSTHLAVYVLFESSPLFSIIALQFPNITPNAIKAMGVLTIAIPPCLNPIIYGISTKEIRDNVARYFKKKAVRSRWK
ncbi:olfactory receptor 52E4-like [Erpetoichthys calabaricus]|uniref:olfactory receptor 52E4-like n=1 Tax=Erpetoichthys calabaricus TaxID=27687 RepID=UPI0022349CD4|nr:olfactory receptor 52E4-like [Erpetoichthys calabaricus]